MPNVQNRKEPDWQKLRGMGLFLACFRVPHTYQEVAEVIDWTLVLRWEPEAVVEGLVAADLLEPAEPAESLNQRLQRFKVPELQAMSERRGLPVSRTKEELVAELVLRDRESMERGALCRTLLKCTDHGADVVDTYLAQGVEKLPQQREVPLDVALKVLKWLALAGSAGVIGDAAYDLLKAAYNSLEALTKKVRAQAPTLTKTPVPTNTPMPTGTPTPPPRSLNPEESQVLAVLQRYEEIRLQSLGPSHDITGLETILAENSLDTHLASVEWLRQNNAYYLISVHETHVEEISVLSPTRIDVLVNKLESREFCINGKLGAKNTVYKDQYQVRYQFKRIEGSWFIVERSSITPTPTETSVMWSYS